MSDTRTAAELADLHASPAYQEAMALQCSPEFIAERDRRVAKFGVPPTPTLEDIQEQMDRIISEEQTAMEYDPRNDPDAPPRHVPGEEGLSKAYRDHVAEKQRREDAEAVAERRKGNGQAQTIPLEGTKATLTVDDKGVPHKSQANVRTALKVLGVGLSHDTFAHRLICEYDGRSGNVDDAIVERLWLETDERYRFRPSLSFFRIVLQDTARGSPFHPVCDYLDALEWDETARVDRWLTTYGKAKDTEYVRAVATLILIAAVRRVRHPGCKFDELPIFESPQGWDKSQAIRLLCPRDEWFSDSLPLGADAKRTIEGTSGVWLIEVAELQGKTKRDLDQLKAALSRQVDGPVRMAYERLPATVPRQFVAIGTTNKSAYLVDSTGNRRFWPVEVGRFDIKALRRDRDQLWAEAAHREGAGESIRLRRELWPKAAEEQEARRIEDPWEEVLADRLGDRDGKVSSEQLWQIVGVQASHRTQADNDRLGSVMKKLGFERSLARFGGKPKRAYRRGDGHQLLVPDPQEDEGEEA